MAFRRRARDLDLLDSLDALDRTPFDGNVWRVVRKDRDPLIGFPSAARWDPGLFDVLYTSLEKDGAIAEMHFHLSRQPVYPSKIKFTASEIAICTKKTLKFADLRELQPLGVKTEEYARVTYERTQEIGDAAAFLGFDGIISPSARWKCLNLVIFSDRVEPGDMELRTSSVVNFVAWRRKRDERLRGGPNDQGAIY